MSEGKSVVNYDAKYAAAAEQYASEEQMTGGTFLSTRGGILQFGEEELPGNQMCVIILDSVKENTYYAGKFNEDEPQAPVCYAFGRGNDEMGPHESMQNHPETFEPQAESCDSCKFAEWGSADQGRGKACQNRRRLAVIPAGFYEKIRGSRDFNLELFEDEKHFRTCDIAFLKLPVMSVKEWSKYVAQLSAAHHRPPYGVVTRIYLEPDPKAQYKVKFEMLELLPDAFAEAVMSRNEEAQRGIITPYSPPQERQPNQARGRR